jgi:hypothetical protein
MAISIHRFRELTALYLRTVDDSGRPLKPGVTFYLTPDEARELADVLQQYAISAANIPFTESKLGTWEADWNGSRFVEAHGRKDKES